MWQPTWSPHPPQGALHGQQVGTPSNPLQGLQQNTIASQPMTQTQWMGPSSGPHGCPPGSMASPVLGPASFPGPCGQHPSNFSSSLGPPASGHQGSGFAVQCKHHQGCHSSMQNQQLMMGSNPSSASPWVLDLDPNMVDTQGLLGQHSQPSNNLHLHYLHKHFTTTMLL